MSRLISVEIRSLGELFAGRRRYRLPWFQRAYSWQTPQVARLVGDLIEAMSNSDGPGYLLGTLMLADVDGVDGFAIVDGHQRIVTLTIVAAVLRDLEPPGSARDTIAGFVHMDARGIDGFRLRPQTAGVDFLAAVVQRDLATSVEIDESEASFSDSERRIVEVREYLRGRLAGDNHPARSLRQQLVRFLAERCHVIVHVYDSEDYAWRALSVEEETRLAFDQAAQAKATILGVMPLAEREEAGLIWEECEDRIGAPALADLLGHIRTLKSRRRSEKPLEHEICELFDLGRSGREFISAWLRPHMAGFVLLRREDEGSAGDGFTTLPERARKAVVRTGFIEPRFWVPAALYWLSQRGASHPDTVDFFRKLERLTWMLRLAGIDPPIQRRRILDVVEELDHDTPPHLMRALAIEPALAAGTVDSLRAQNFGLKSHAGGVLRRLSALRGRDPGPVDKKSVTIEHMLPRNPDRNRQWWRSFRTKDEIKAHVNRLGNLTFLTHADNQQAGTQDWPEKRTILANSGFVLSEDAAAAEGWDQVAITTRTETLIQSLFRDWEVGADKFPR